MTTALPSWLDFGRDRNPNWHRRWLTLMLTAGPLLIGAGCIFGYGPEKGLAAAALFIGTALVKGIEYGFQRRKEGEAGE